MRGGHTGVVVGLALLCAPASAAAQDPTTGAYAGQGASIQGQVQPVPVPPLVIPGGPVKTTKTGPDRVLTVPSTTTTERNGAAPASDSGEGEGAGPGRDAGAPAGSPAPGDGGTGAAARADASTVGSLPFTGLDLGLVTAAGLLLIALGLGLRRATRRGPVVG